MSRINFSLSSPEHEYNIESCFSRACSIKLYSADHSICNSMGKHQKSCETVWENVLTLNAEYALPFSMNDASYRYMSGQP